MRTLVIQIAKGLEVICSRGLVHRDIKSPNILLSYEGEARIADFGLARAYSSGLVMSLESTSNVL